MDRQKRSMLVRSSYSGSWRYLDDQGSGDGYRPAGEQIEFFTFCVGHFFNGSLRFQSEPNQLCFLSGDKTPKPS